jgi:Sec-independent protein translocase protein TatA
MGSLSIWHWLIALGVVVVIFRVKERGSIGYNVEETILNIKTAIHRSKTANYWIAAGLVLLLCLLVAASHRLA